MAQGRSAARQRLGLRGEHAAALALERRGLSVLQRRYRCRLGEVDLVARDGDAIVFVEVKARRGSGYGEPAEAVTPAKQRRLARVALRYLQQRGWLERPCRFDVVEVRESVDGTTQVRHLIDAFRPC
ncbi:MAG: YraN family protein [bacterium]|nr:YraN family protein [bacterium]